MSQRRQYHALNIYWRHFRTTIQQRVHFAAEDQGLSAARARTIAKVLLRQGMSELRRRLCCHHKPDSILLNLLRYGHLQRRLSQLQDFFGVPYAFDRWLVQVRGAVENRMNAFYIRKIHLHLQKETVQLCFRQCVCRLQFQRVQRSEHNEWMVELIRLASDGHRLLPVSYTHLTLPTSD